MTVSKFDDPDAVWAGPAPGRYCLARCYCGSCPQYTAVDRDAILSSTGRRTSTEEHRAARQERAAKR